MILTIAGEDYTVEYVEDARVIEGEIRKDAPPFLTFDSETTGLHIKKDKPFLAAVCFGMKVFVFPATRQNLFYLPSWSRLVKRTYGHNLTYDMHMVANMTSDTFPIRIENWGDTMALIRLSVEAKSTRHGGDRIGLKPFSAKYIDREADRFEKAVKGWLKAKRAQDRKVLIGLLAGVKDDKGKWSMKRFEMALNEGSESIPKDVMDLFNEWNRCYPKPTYQDVPIEIMLPYLAVDVILTKLIVYKCLPVVVHRKQVEIMNKEFDLLKVVYKMERQGLKVDREYLQDCNIKLGKYIEDLYTHLHLLSGLEFSVGQHAVIKKIYADLLGEEPESTDKKFLKKMEAKGDEMAGIITKLRRLEKWQETYVVRLLEASEYDGRVYTQMSQFNPVSGRFSGDLQQMPRDPIVDENGEIIYHPRRAFLPTGNGFKYLHFMDFSQVELRVTAHYTLLFGGDVNMTRAYMPFQCTHYKTGEVYQFDTDEDRNRWSEKQEDGKSVWLDENGEPWHETDVHMATTLKALVAMGKDPTTMDAKDLKWWRNKGKTFNFARNYGVGDQHAAETLEISLEQAKAMNQGYTDAFPKVVDYQNWVINTVRNQGYAENLFGRRYYLSDWNKAYAVANYLVQGSCADDLKNKMILIDKFLEPYQSRMLICIHDEIVYEIHEGEEHLIPQIKAIKEYTPIVKIPLVSEVKYTETNWSEKRVWEC